MKDNSKLLTTETDWTPELLEKFFVEIERIGRDYLKYENLYPNQIEIISSEQMLDASSTVAMPVMYPHWSFGKSFAYQQKSYEKGHSGLAYEVVINCLKCDTLVVTTRGIIEIKDIKVGDFVWNGKQYVEVTHTKTSNQKTYNLKLSNKMSFEPTKRHKHYVVSKDSSVPCIKTTDQLQIGDWLLQPQYSTINNNTVDLSEFYFIPPTCGFGDRYAFQPYCKIPHEMNESLAELLGILVGDGCVSHTMKHAFYVAVGHDSEGYDTHVIRLIKDVFDVDVKIYEQPSTKYPDKFNKNLYVISNEIKEFLDYCGLRKTMTHKNKEVPWSVLQSSSACQRAFLRGLFDTDGTVKSSNGRFTCMSFSGVNKKLIDQVSVMLTSLGICNTIRTVSNQKIFIVDILSDGNVKFVKDIFSNHSVKQRKQEMILTYNQKLNTDQGILSKLPVTISEKSRGMFLRYNTNELVHDYRFIKIEGIECTDTHNDVVDITVNSSDHLFVANGLLTHNCTPTVAYCMETNTMMMQALVMAHASIGHNAVFSNNYLFKQWTDAEGIIDYLVFAKHYINECEEKYGEQEVERFLDACHALQSYGVDRYTKPQKLSLKQEKDRQQQREEYYQQQVNELWSTIPKRDGILADGEIKQTGELTEPEDNLLYFIEKRAPNLEQWQREIVRIVRKISQYFYPQRQTQVVNEGCASFTHYEIMNKLYDEGLVSDGFMMEFIESHSGVIRQLPFDHKYYSGFNPYALGFAMFQDIKRVSIEPTDEDRNWFRDQEWVGRGDWQESCKWAMSSFKDESFIRQFLSPKVMRDFRMFSIINNEESKEYVVSDIHNTNGYKQIRDNLADQYMLFNREPQIQITHVDFRGDRSITLKHVNNKGQILDEKDALKVLQYFHYLWQFDVKMNSYHEYFDKELGCSVEKPTAFYKQTNEGPIIEFFDKK